MKLPFLLGSLLKLLRGPPRDQEGADLLSSPEAFSGNVLTRSQDPGWGAGFCWGMLLLWMECQNRKCCVLTDFALEAQPIHFPPLFFFTVGVWC